MTENIKYILKINTTERNKIIISLLDNTTLIDEYIGGGDLVSNIRSLLDKNKVKLEDINEVVPNVGPGSFTGIKKGITVANILNWSLENNKSYKPNYGGEPNIT